ncbi:MAG TPA: hypothetical protein VEK10_06470 [Steroidobacteraceae bacterium]|nr:hypothetical protein [Steroidobacteraceae bacterium]
MSEPSERIDDTLTLVGQLGTTTEALRPAFRAARTVDDLVPILRNDGNFLLIYRRAAEVFIVNSHYSLNNYFYTEQDGRFFHGDTIQSLVEQGACDLEWNFESIADLLALEHVIGNATLLRSVRAVPMGTIQHWDGARLVSRSYPWQEFREVAAGSGRDVAERLIALLLEGLRAGAGSRVLLAASSGLDSRVNLAGLLHLGMKPELMVMGQPGAKDAEIVTAMGRALGLTVNRIVPQPGDFVDGATQVARLTNGVKPLNHWHTFVLASKAGYGATERVLTGNNGEHVRAVGFDYGVLAHALDATSRIGSPALTEPLLRRYWTRKRWLPLEPAELAHCARDFVSYYGSEQQIDKIMSVMPRMSFVWQCDDFILEQRRKGFQAAGLKLFRTYFPIYSPFLNKRWIDAGWSLPLGWRLDSRWHRYTVMRLYPRLTAFPEERERAGLRLHAKPLHWMPGINHLYGAPRVVPYVDYDGLLRRDDVLALLYDNAAALDGLMSRELVHRIIDTQRKTGRRARVFSVLAAIALWRASLTGRSTPAGAAPTQFHANQCVA